MLRRYVVVGGEPELALLLHIFPEGVEELDGAFAVYADEPPLGFDVVTVDEVDEGWPDKWRDFHHGVRIGRLWVGPPWEEPPADAIAVVIDPGRAFGTGAHATTRLCLELLQEVEPTSLLDVGCGSGVLSIAAAKLGFAPIRAVDVDDVALETTRANAAANEVEIEVGAEFEPARARGDEHRARRGRGDAPAAPGRARDHIRLSRARRAARRRLAPAGTARPRRLGGGPARIPAVTTFSVRFLGCKVSHVDAHAVRERLLVDGHDERDGGAEVAVVNTCCVTHEAVAKSRKEAARAARTHGRVYVTGCGANLAGEAFAGLPDNVVVVARRSEETPAFVAGDVGAIGCVQAEARLDRVRAFVKVQDGCSFSCRFCVIPLVRGASRSRPAEAVLAEIRRRVEQGHREVVLTGINLGCYRDRAAGYRLARLVREAGATPGLERLRLSSIEINHVDDELVCALRETPNASRHLHVPLQSGDDAVLRAMGRRYSVGTYLRRLEPLRDDFNLTSDVIVGFPTEDERAFENTLRVVGEAGLTKVHVFPYSPRPGTGTAADDPVPPREKKERSARLRAASHEACLAHWRSKIGRDDVVLVDRRGRGYGDDYSPWLVPETTPVGELVGVRGGAVSEEGILAA